MTQPYEIGWRNALRITGRVIYLSMLVVFLSWWAICGITIYFNYRADGLLDESTSASLFIVIVIFLLLSFGYMVKEISEAKYVYKKIPMSNWWVVVLSLAGAVVVPLSAVVAYGLNSLIARVTGRPIMGDDTAIGFTYSSLVFMFVIFVFVVLSEFRSSGSSGDNLPT